MPKQDSLDRMACRRTSHNIPNRLQGMLMVGVLASRAWRAVLRMHRD